MKSYNIQILLISLISLILGCKKDESINVDHKRNNSKLYPKDTLIVGENPVVIPPFNYVSPITPKATLINGILKFSSLNDFENTINELDNEFDNFKGYDPYIENYGTNLDLLNEVLDQNNVDEDIVYKSYESKYSGFISFRNKLLNLESEYLNTIGSSPENLNNPENYFYYNDDSFNSLLNSKGELIIENIILKIFDNGMTYAITNGDLNLLKSLSSPNGLPSDYYSKNIYNLNSNVILLSPQIYCDIKTLSGETLPTDLDYCSNINMRTSDRRCKLWLKKTNRTELYDSNKRAVSNIRLINIGIWNRASTKIINYKFKNGKYKRSRQYLQCSIQQKDNLYCGTYIDETKGKLRLRKSRRQKSGRFDPLVSTAGTMIYSVICFLYSINTDCKSVTVRAENGKFSSNNTYGNKALLTVGVW